jgi:serine acetyltransferase
VSFRREDYLRVGGFDPAFRISEDAELGIRLEAAGATFAFSEGAEALHASDHTRLEKWMRRSEAYGIADAMVSDKHSTRPSANPWRFLFLVNPVSRPLLLASAMAPRAMKPVAWLAARLSQLVAALGAERLAMAGMTLTYGMQYFRGLHGAPPPPEGRSRFQRYLNATEAESLGFFGRFAKCWADIRADHAMLRGADDRYGTRAKGGSVLGDAVQRIGFQMMVAYRVMRLLRSLRLGIMARIWSRVMRHLYASDIHWDAQLAPGVVIVHGTGLVISHAARVGPGCILFQHVTLGESIHAQSRLIGAPTLEANVHVGPGATLLGPIVIGEGSKVTASALVMDSVPARSLVETPAPVVRARGAGRGTLAEQVESMPGVPSGARATTDGTPERAASLNDGARRSAIDAPAREEEG